MRHLLSVCMLTCVLAGCTSISSTLVNRLDNDMFVGNSNGDPTNSGGTRPFKGIPITLRVPTHLDVVVKETIWLNFGSDGHLFQYQTPRRHLFVESRLVETDKVFTVDPKRPAAGTLAYTLTFGAIDSGNRDNTQYFKTITNNLTDTTINDVNASLKTILPILGKFAKPGGSGGSAFGGGEGGDSNRVLASMIEQHRVVAWKRFDLDAPDFEEQIECFIDRHVNACNDCRQYGANCPCPVDQ